MAFKIVVPYGIQHDGTLLSRLPHNLVEEIFSYEKAGDTTKSSCVRYGESSVTFVPFTTSRLSFRVSHVMIVSEDVLNCVLDPNDIQYSEREEELASLLWDIKWPEGLSAVSAMHALREGYRKKRVKLVGSVAFAVAPSSISSDQAMLFRLKTA